MTDRCFTSGGFGIEGTPRGRVLLCQPLLRLIANFVGPISDLTLSLTLPFRRRPWKYHQKEWKCPGSPDGTAVWIIPTLRAEEESETTMALRISALSYVRPSMCNFRFNTGMGVYGLWSTLGCPESFALRGNIPPPSEETRRQYGTTFYPEGYMICDLAQVPREDHVQLLWAMGESKRAHLLKSGADRKLVVAEMDPGLKKEQEMRLYLAGLLDQSETDFAPSDVLYLCQREDKRERDLAIPFLKGGRFHNNENMGSLGENIDDPSTPYEYLLFGRVDVFLFITQHTDLDADDLRMCNQWKYCVYWNVVSDYILFSKYRRDGMDLRKCERADCSEELLCDSCRLWREMMVFHLRIGKDDLDECPEEKECPGSDVCSSCEQQREKKSYCLEVWQKDLPLPHSSWALRTLLDAYLFRRGIPQKEFRKGLMRHLGTGFMKGVKGRTGLGGKIDRVLVALSQGKKELFATRLLALMERQVKG